MIKYDTVLIRYGELSTKGKNRKLFVAKLLQNIKQSLGDLPSLEYRQTYERIYIKLNDEDPNIVADRLKEVFGISSFSLTQKVASDIEVIVEACYQASLNEKGTFKVIARRNDKSFPYISDQINRMVASKILKESEHKVDVHHPDFKIYIEVFEDGTYITCNKIDGAHGYPTGINGKTMMLLSGGIDSPVAGYLMMKRGIACEAIHFAAPPYTSNLAREKVLSLAKIISKYQGGSMKVHIVNFTALQKAIYEYCHDAYAITIMRRMMMRIAQEVAQKNHCLAISTGESLGQVASQTLESVQCINEVTNFPIIRPVVTYDKEEIIELAKKIGTFATSILPYEDCCTIFDPKNPVTKPTIHKAHELEKRFDYEAYIQECLDTIETVYVNMNETEEDFL
ncbi:MAG: tRNA 4-thiouridine(8) synthase ThiI [Erysipelotrichaceae bacterium]|nr:tRNA 4-thiouridine(8) synthase ThiI [Erysipelotrichaceae bacterium]MDY5251379.1 tRNA uracil 4-sulfurtransferase ThiI [Erysipelotrichaceae bacterium]